MTTLMWLPVWCAAVQTLQSEGIFPVALQMHTVKPLDNRCTGHLAERVETLVVVEEATPTGGGLYSAVCQWHASCARPPRLKRLGPPDELALGNFSARRYADAGTTTADAVATTVRALWSTRQLLYRVAA